MNLVNKAVRLKWVDSNGFVDGGWIPTENLDRLQPTLITSVGQVYKEDEDFLTITMSLSDDGQSMGSVAIPRCAILSVEVLDEKP